MLYKFKETLKASGEKVEHKLCAYAVYKKKNQLQNKTHIQLDK